MSRKARERVAQYDCTVKSSQRNFEGVGESSTVAAVIHVEERLLGASAEAIAFSRKHFSEETLKCFRLGFQGCRIGSDRFFRESP